MTVEKEYFSYVQNEGIMAFDKDCPSHTFEELMRMILKGVEIVIGPVMLLSIYTEELGF